MKIKLMYQALVVGGLLSFTVELLTLLLIIIINGNEVAPSWVATWFYSSFLSLVLGMVLIVVSHRKELI